MDGPAGAVVLMRNWQDKGDHRTRSGWLLKIEFAVLALVSIWGIGAAIGPLF